MAGGGCRTAAAPESVARFALLPVSRLWWPVSRPSRPSRPVAPGRGRIGTPTVGLELSLPGLLRSLLRELVFPREVAIVEAGQGTALDLIALAMGLAVDGLPNSGHGSGYGHERCQFSR